MLFLFSINLVNVQNVWLLEKWKLHSFVDGGSILVKSIGYGGGVLGPRALCFLSFCLALHCQARQSGSKTWWWVSIVPNMLLLLTWLLYQQANILLGFWARQANIFLRVLRQARIRLERYIDVRLLHTLFSELGCDCVCGRERDLHLDL